MENTNEDSAVQADYEPEDALSRLVDVSHSLAKNTGILVGKGCKTVTQWSNAVKHACEKIIGAQSVSGEEDLYSQLADPAMTVADARMDTVFKASSALDPGLEETSPSKRAMRALVTALETDIAVARNQLQEAQNQIDPLTPKLKALEAEKRSLARELKRLRGHDKDRAPQEDVVSERASVLESDPSADQGRLSESIQDKVTQTVPNSVEPLIEKAAKTDERTSLSSSRQESEASAIQAEVPDSPEVTKEEIEAADFSSPADKVILANALSELTGSRDEGLRIYAAKAIGPIQHELTVKVLVAQIAREPSTKVRQECIKALGALGMKEGQDTVERALGDEIVAIRLAAVRALYDLAGAESAPALIGMFRDADEMVRRRAATYIGRFGKKEYGVDLLALLNDSSVLVRRAAIESMANLRCREAVCGFIDHLNDPDR